MSDILLFGLSGDPVHLGHLKTIEFLKQQFPRHQIIIMPCKNNPIPKMDSQQTSGEIRLRMLQEIQNDTNSPYLKNVVISDYEILKTSPSYTIDTVDYLFAKYHPRSITLVIGTDNFEQFPKWRDFKRLLELTNLLVINRPQSHHHFQEIIQNYGYNIHQLSEMPGELGPYHYDLIFIKPLQRLYYVYENDHLEELAYNEQINTLLQSSEMNKLHLHTNKIIQFFEKFKRPQLLKSKFKQAHIKEITGPQINISSSQIRLWFREGQFHKIAEVILPITYKTLRESYKNNQLSNDYISLSNRAIVLPTVEDLFK